LGRRHCAAQRRLRLTSFFTAEIAEIAEKFFFAFLVFLCVLCVLCGKDQFG